jgi:threonyl-tRNA synthetase
MADGSKRKGTSWETSPMDVAKTVSKSLCERVIIAKVSPAARSEHSNLTYSRSMANFGTWNGRWRAHASSNFLILNIPRANASSGIRLHMYLEKQRSDIMVATSASVLRLKTVFSTRWPLKIGQNSRNVTRIPLTRYRSVSQADYPALEKLSDAAIKDKQRFERLIVSKEMLLRMFNVSSNAADGV